MSGISATQIRKRRGYGWTATSYVDIDPNRKLLLRIATHRVGNHLETVARVYKDNMTEIAMFTDQEGDFCERLLSEPASRVTQSMVEAQHRRASDQIAEVTMRATAYYTDK